mmetsp:Transcript_35519/g.29891  ORF Transcript_35519/g.29891 Transcript_35519/m.29891 type:complete len:169 (+) Transcript_35519:690-1196(+)
MRNELAASREKQVLDQGIAAALKQRNESLDGTLHAVHSDLHLVRTERDSLHNKLENLTDDLAAKTERLNLFEQEVTRNSTQLSSFSQQIVLYRDIITSYKNCNYSFDHSSSPNKPQSSKETRDLKIFRELEIEFKKRLSSDVDISDINCALDFDNEEEVVFLKYQIDH